MKAITVGSAMIDIITVIADEDIERIKMTNATTSFLMMEQGRKIDARSITTHVGGGAVNAAVALSRLGHNVSPLVKIGFDLQGDTVLELFGKEGLGDENTLRVKGDETGVSVILASHDRDASIFARRGANCLLVDSDISSDIFRNVKLVHIAPLSNESADVFPTLVQTAAESGAFVVSNPGARQLTSRPDAFFDSLHHINLLNINRTEAEVMLERLFARSNKSLRLVKSGPVSTLPPLFRRGILQNSYHATLPGFMGMMLDTGLTNIMITDGTGGAYLGTSDGVYHCPVLETRVKGTAGAGDAFTSTSGALLASGKSPREALQAGAVNASSVVAHIDTQSGLLQADVLSSRILEHQDKLGVAFWPWTTN